MVTKDGQNATFQCQAKAAGNMSIKYLWKFNHSYVNENNSIRVKMESDSHFSILWIDKVNLTLHAGIYQCLAMVLDYGSIISIPAMLEIACMCVSNSYNSHIHTHYATPHHTTPYHTTPYHTTPHHTTPHHTHTTPHHTHTITETTFTFFNIYAFYIAYFFS